MGDLNISQQTKTRLVGCTAAVVFIGGLFSIFGISGKEGAHYFAHRKNFLNALFVKQGWSWFTVAFWAAFSSRRDRARSVLNSACRWTAATAWWMLFAQWLVGPPLMDRMFTATGGICKVNDQDVTVSSSKACRSDGGVWVGGHDPSGHVFLSTLSSIVLFSELVPSSSDLRTMSLREFVRVHKRACIASAIQLNNYFILFLTCVYFHSFWERLTGFLFASAEIYLVYYMGETYYWGRWFGTSDVGLVFDISSIISFRDVTLSFSTPAEIVSTSGSDSSEEADIETIKKNSNTRSGMTE